MRFELARGLLSPLFTILGMGRRHSWMEVEQDQLRVQMGWAFRMLAQVDAVASAEEVDDPTPFWLGIGVHGWRRRWAVNTARKPHVVIRFAAPQRAWTAGFPIRVAVLHLSPADPPGLLRALQR